MVVIAWARHDKVVIVDIDGTVTRTDAGGVQSLNPPTLKWTDSLIDRPIRVEKDRFAFQWTDSRLDGRATTRS